MCYVYMSTGGVLDAGVVWAPVSVVGRRLGEVNKWLPHFVFFSFSPPPTRFRRSNKMDLYTSVCLGIVTSYLYFYQPYSGLRSRYAV